MLIAVCVLGHRLLILNFCTFVKVDKPKAAGLRALIEPVAIVLAGLGLASYAMLGRIPFYVPAAVPAAKKYPDFVDDRLEDKKPPFAPDIIDSRLVEKRWQINASAAVIKLDMLDVDPGDNERYARLYPSYSAAASNFGYGLLPSLNLLDGKAKQFDEGLLAALQLRAASGLASGDLAPFLGALLFRLDASGDTYAWLWGGLRAARLPIPVKNASAAREPSKATTYLKNFESDEYRSKPLAQYTWSPQLEQTWRLVRYFQEPLQSKDPRARELAALLAKDSELKKSYARLLGLFAGLSAPADRASLLDAGRSEVYFLPPSVSKDAALIDRLMAQGLPDGADIMLELVKAIRSGRLDLKPGAKAGWLDYEVYALETFLLPEKGEEKTKLLLTKKYKKSMLEAFMARMTTRRESHSLMETMSLGELASDRDDSTPPPFHLSPRLRVEPNPTYYLRMARSYAFLEKFIRTYYTPDELNAMRGYKPGGVRAQPLGRELAWMKDLYYGLHLISCEDLGMKPLILVGELPARGASLKIAQQWLGAWPKDEDLAVDARVIVPIAHDPMLNITRYWATLGVRGARLSATYARQPSFRDTSGHGSREWGPVPWDQLEAQQSVVLVDEFAEIEVRGRPPLRREDLQRIADREKTKDGIIAALSR